MTTQDARPIKIEVKNLTKRFGDLLVLDDMNFTIRKGEFLAIVGPTGCGISLRDQGRRGSISSHTLRCATRSGLLAG